LPQLTHVQDIKDRYRTILDLGSGSGHISKFLTPDLAERLIQVEMSRKLLTGAGEITSSAGLAQRDNRTTAEVPTETVIMDEEHLKLKPDSVDAVLSSLSLHWVNDLSGNNNYI
jgi:NADH dehydrogenase [ubiquinone] 1 alpha subcomplex assembly factor 5